MDNTRIMKSENCLEIEEHDCKNCIPQEKEIKDVRLAQAYVPFQKYCSTYMPLEALMNGTAFPELYMPYSLHHCHHCGHEKHHCECNHEY